MIYQISPLSTLHAYFQPSHQRGFSIVDLLKTFSWRRLIAFWLKRSFAGFKLLLKRSTVSAKLLHSRRKRCLRNFRYEVSDLGRGDCFSWLTGEPFLIKVMEGRIDCLIQLTRISAEEKMIDHLWHKPLETIGRRAQQRRGALIDILI